MSKSSIIYIYIITTFCCPSETTILISTNKFFTRFSNSVSLKGSSLWKMPSKYTVLNLWVERASWQQKFKCAHSISAVTLKQVKHDNSLLTLRNCPHVFLWKKYWMSASLWKLEKQTSGSREPSLLVSSWLDGEAVTLTKHHKESGCSHYPEKSSLWSTVNKCISHHCKVKKKSVKFCSSYGLSILAENINVY